MKTELKNKVVLVTGGTRGIGRATALQLAECGAKVAICGRRSDSLAHTLRELRKIDPHAVGIIADASKPDEIQSMIQEIETTLGTIDILVNNAGVYTPASLEDTTLDEWERQFSINLKGPFLVTQAVLPKMRERNEGRIIFISSTIAIISPPGNSLYTATKWGIEGFAGCIGQELCSEGINVHLLRPGFTDTSIFDVIGKPDWDIDWIQPEEIADAVEYLCRLPKHAHVPEMTYMTTFQRMTH